jgi:DNA repair exonuclease SbcCD ATPase subunit
MKLSTVMGRALALLLFASVAVSAQSLGDLAKQEEARRKAVKAPGKVYTNGALKAEPPPSTPPTAAPGTPSAEQAAPPQSAGSAPAADPKKEETAWRQKMAAARDALTRAQTFAEALQSRINALTTDFTNRADPVQRAQIANDRDKALAELDRVKKEIQDNTKAIAAIQEDARKAGVPAGWVR